MSKQIINVGSLANDKTGDALRTAFGKVNANFTELYSGVATRWEQPAEGCPIYTELTSQHYYAYTQNSHLALENTGYWDIGSNSNSTGIFGLDNNTIVYSNGGDVNIRTTGSSVDWKFKSTDSSFQFPNGNSGISSWGPYQSVIYSEFNEQYENSLTLTSVPANQFAINGSAQGPNNLYGYPVSMFDDGLIFGGYGYDANPNGPYIDKHAVITPNSTFDIVTNVETTTNLLTYVPNGDYETFTWNGYVLSVVNASTNFTDNLNTLHIGDSIIIHQGANQYNLIISNRLDALTLKVNTASPSANISATSVTLNQPIVTLNKWNFGMSGDLTLPTSGGIVFDRNNTSIRVGMGFHIASGEGISLEAIDETDPNNLVTKNWYFGTDGTLTLPPSNNTLYTSNNALIKSISDIQISAGDDVGSNWIFKGNGTTLFPNNTLQTSTDFVIKTTNRNVNSSYNAGSTYTSIGLQDDTSGKNPAWAYIEADMANANTPSASIIVKPGDTGDEVRWNFNAKGKLTLPKDGQIVDCHGISVIVHPYVLDIEIDGGTTNSVYSKNDIIFDGGSTSSIFTFGQAVIDGCSAFSHSISKNFDGGSAVTI